MSRGRSGMDPFRAGVLALVLIAAAIYLGVNKGVPIGDGYSVRAVVATANELHPGSPVRIAGINVGKVTGVRRGAGRTAIVDMRIDARGRPVHRDATLKIRPRIFLEGNFFVDLDPGTPGAPELADGGLIPLAQTSVLVQFDEVLGALDAPTRGSLQTLLQEYGRSLARGGAAALRRSFPDWAPTFRAGAQTMEAFRGLREDDLSAWIRASAKASSAFAHDRRALGDLVTSFRRTAGALADRDAQLGATIRELAATGRVARPSLAAINDSLPSLRRLARDVRPSLRRAPATLDRAQPALEQLRGLLRDDELRGLVRDLRPAVRTLNRLQPRLVGLTDRVLPVTECVRTRANPVLTAAVKDGPHTTGAPVWQEFTSGLVGLSSAAQNFDGVGPIVRYLAGFGDQLVSTGEVPGVGKLFGTSPEALIGSRPAKPKQPPPYRPNARCIDQAPVDLSADMRPAPAARKAPAPKLGARRQAELRSLSRLLAKAGGR